MAASPSSASGTSSPSSSGGAANLLAALASAAGGAAGEGGGGHDSPEGDRHHGAPSAAKYQKLAAEYAKLRSHFGVVKKAVLEEQAKSAELAEAVRARDVAHRKSEAEMEAVVFRNQQLTKRVQVLQEELELVEARGKRGGKKSRDGTSTAPATDSNRASDSQQALNSVMGQELQAKIEENASLHARLSDVDARYEQLVSSLRARVAELEAEGRERAQAERAEETKRADAEAGLRADNDRLAAQLRGLERELVDHQDRITVLTVQLESAAPSATPNSGAAQPFVDPDSNFPLSAADSRVQSVELLSQFESRVTTLVAAFSDFHTYWEHRLKDLSGGADVTWDSAASLSALLLQNVSFLKPIEEAFQDVLAKVLASSDTEGIQALPPVLALLEPFATKLRAYVDFACEAEALTVSCLQYESQRYSCPPSQQAFNSQLGSCLRAFNRVLSRAADYLVAAAAAAKTEDGTAAQQLDALSVCLSQLSSQAGELSRTYANKSADEDALPTAPEQLRNTNQCIVAALASVERTLADLSRLLAQNLPRINLLLLKPALDDSSHLQRRAPQDHSRSADANSSKRSDTESIQQRISLEEELKLAREAETRLNKTVSEMEEKIKTLEQKREHWKLEYQMLKIKHDKLREESGNGSVGDKCDEAENPIVAMLRECRADRLLADAQAVALALELSSQRSRLAAAEKRREAASAALAAATRQAEVGRQEAAAAAESYEAQLGLMAEHVAHMNDRLTAQSDEVERLKFELASAKGGKKGKSGK